MTLAAFLSFIPPAINVAKFFFLEKLIAGGIFHGHETCYTLSIESSVLKLKGPK